MKLRDGSFQFDSHQNRDSMNLTRVCRKLRAEFYSYMMSQTTISVDLKDVGGYAACFDRAFKACAGSLIITVVPTEYSFGAFLHTPIVVELLPLLTLAIDAPKLRITMDSRDCTCILGLGVGLHMRSALDPLIDLSRGGGPWSGYLREGFASVTLYPIWLISRSESHRHCGLHMVSPG
jgi:hypothetical protein